VAVFEPFLYQHQTIRVDIVCQGGSKWIKIKAAHPRSLNKDFHNFLMTKMADEEEDWLEKGMEEYPLCRQVRELCETANTHLFNYKPPTVIIRLCPSINDSSYDERLISYFYRVGAFVEFQPLDSPAIPLHRPNDKNLEIESVSLVNLDVTTLIALTTDMTHRYSAIPIHTFQNPALLVQFRQEEEKPLLPVLLDYLKDKSMICTTSAIEKLVHIAKTIAGPTEMARILTMFDSNALTRYSLHSLITVEPFLHKTIQLVPDKISERFQKLSSMNETQKCIFGTGDELRATTMTSNRYIGTLISDSKWWLNQQESCMNGCSVWIHEPRSFIEKKC
jgi:hypothetical protein